MKLSKTDTDNRSPVGSKSPVATYVGVQEPIP